MHFCLLFVVLWDLCSVSFILGIQDFTGSFLEISSWISDPGDQRSLADPSFKIQDGCSLWTCCSGAHKISHTVLITGIADNS